ncbi:hypothetical protein FQN52_001285 [Onygenales sp. PD_12]|nr:hypothetical protein FQN52_001285 [Onygenales sp. PD_12]
MASNHRITIRETNKIGVSTATYIYSTSSTSRRSEGIRGGQDGRVDIIPPSQKESASYMTSLLNVFLPVGYPHSVSDDYLEAVLQGVGVGDASASPTAALLYSILQESMGRIATILFAHRLGTSLEPECKMYRLAADVLNDSAMIFDCLSPVFPKPMRVLLLSFSSVLRALCGVAAGSSKASLSSHFARWGNLGELNAKDSSQETVISLLGMLCGSLVVSHISSPFATWTTLLLLLLIHISTNYAAVRAVNMTTLNRQRANIVFSTLYDEDHVLTPAQTSKGERIFERDGILRWKASSTILGSCCIGVSFQDLLLSRCGSSRRNSIRDVGLDIPRLLHIFEKEEYILWFNPVSKKGIIVLKNNVTPVSQLKAWSHALMVSKYVAAESQNGSQKLSKEGGNSKRGQQGNYNATDATNSMYSIFESTLQSHSKRFDNQILRLKEAGWDVDTPSLETRPGRRLEIAE